MDYFIVGMQNNPTNSKEVQYELKTRSQLEMKIKFRTSKESYKIWSLHLVCTLSLLGYGSLFRFLTISLSCFMILNFPIEIHGLDA